MTPENNVKSQSSDWRMASAQMVSAASVPLPLVPLTLQELGEASS